MKVMDLHFYKVVLLLLVGCLLNKGICSLRIYNNKESTQQQRQQQQTQNNTNHKKKYHYDNDHWNSTRMDWTNRVLKKSSTKCPRDNCGKWRTRMRRIRHNERCRDRCKLTLFGRWGSGWECGTCEEWKDTVSGYNVEIVFDSINDPIIQDMFHQAAERWESVITGDVPSRKLPLGRRNGSKCNKGSLPKLVDDVVICVSLIDIDGPGRVVARASAEYRRKHTSTTIYGVMEFDRADLNPTLRDDSLKGIALHEMAHVLGMNRNTWMKLGLINSRSPQCSYKVQSSASKAWQNLTGCGPQLAVPLENLGGDGTACSHFDEACLRTELMTGFIRDPELSLSIVTVGAMEDLGYVVDYAAADNFTNFRCKCQVITPIPNNNTTNTTMPKNSTEPTNTTGMVRHRGLSEDTGYIEALRYGKEFLRNQTKVTEEIATMEEKEDDVEFVGDQYVSIVYYDDLGNIRHIDVTADMI